MEPITIGDRLRRQAAEVPALGNHVGLVGKAHVESGTIPVDSIMIHSVAWESEQ